MTGFGHDLIEAGSVGNCLTGAKIGRTFLVLGAEVKHLGRILRFSSVPREALGVGAV